MSSFFYCCDYQNDLKQKFLKSLPQKSHHQTVAQLPVVTATARNASPAVRNTRILGKRERKKEIKQTNEMGSVTRFRAFDIILKTKKMFLY